jgi:succinate dehydrogenase / fumarate reductase iron-sulfur subunit
MEVAPMDQIGKIKSEILERRDGQASRAIRHRKTLIRLVRQSGWVDERLFGLLVVGNSFRDLRGLLSLTPLGLRMIASGKFPVRFEASEGTATVRSLIDSVKRLDKSAQIEPTSETPEPVGG